MNRLPQPKLIFPSLDWTRPKDPPMSLGQASIIANMENIIEIIDQSWSVNHPDFHPDFVVDFAMTNSCPDSDFALGAFIWNENHVQYILKQLDIQKFPGRIILGGPQISYCSQGLEKYYPNVDIFIRGYAENALKQLYENSNHAKDIPGVHFRNTPDRNTTAEIPKDLESPFLTGKINPQPFIRWETQRGCPFRCSFCQHRSPSKISPRNHFDSTRLVREIRWILDNPIIQDIAVLDPIFNAGPDYQNILKSLEPYTGKISFQARAEMATLSFLESIKRISGRPVLEFGLQTIHKNEMKSINRGNNMKKVSNIFQLIHEMEIESEVSLIFGLPNQTLESFQQSVDYCINAKVKTIHAFPLMLLRGTPLYHQKTLYGLEEQSDFEFAGIPRLQNGIPHVVSCANSFTIQDWVKMAKIAEWLESDYNVSFHQNVNV